MATSVLSRLAAFAALDIGVGMSFSKPIGSKIVNLFLLEVAMTFSKHYFSNFEIDLYNSTRCRAYPSPVEGEGSLGEFLPIISLSLGGRGSG
jgi:hypothetical protein